MNLRKLEVFYYTAKLGSCRKAAKRLVVTQPAVTVQIRELERYYQVRLFSRNHNGLQLTEAGKMLYEYADKIFGLAEEAENRLLEMGKVRKGILKLGTIKTYAKYILPVYISAFQKAYPHVKVILQEGGSIQLKNSVLEMENDIVVAAETKADRRLHSMPFRKEEVFIVVSQRHPWFRRETEVDIEELRKVPVILREKESATRYVISKIFKKYQIEPEVSIEGGSSDFIKEIVKEGRGLSFFVLPSIKKEVEEGVFRPLRLTNERIFLDVRIFFLDKESLSPQAKVFLQILKGKAPS